MSKDAFKSKDIQTNEQVGKKEQREPLTTCGKIPSGLTSWTEVLLCMII